MKLKVGDIVEFKKYEDMSVEDTALIMEDVFPESGKVTEVNDLDNEFTLFSIEGSPYVFNSGSVARVISDVDDYDLGVIRKGDEVLVKATVKEVFNGFIQINSSIDKTDVTQILKRKKPENFIVKEDYYGMYIGVAGELVGSKDTAQVFTSHDDANKEAENMDLNAWKVLPLWRLKVKNKLYKVVLGYYSNKIIVCNIKNVDVVYLIWYAIYIKKRRKQYDD